MAQGIFIRTGFIKTGFNGFKVDYSTALIGPVTVDVVASNLVLCSLNKCSFEVEILNSMMLGLTSLNSQPTPVVV